MLIGSPKASLTMHGSAVLVFERSGRESETARHRAMTDRPPTPRLLLRPVTIPPARRRTFPRERANRRLQCGDGSRINLVCAQRSPARQDKVDELVGLGQRNIRVWKF